ncbi:hypothetical protein [Nonomuraea sp. NPDC001699]
MAVHEQAVDAVVDLRRNETHGQDSLFGERGRSSAFSIAIPQGEWDRATLLAFEREMLGLYVSSHPLDGAEHVLDANRDTTIAELRSSGRQDAPVRVSGIVSGLQREITKQGSPWAIVTLEDHDAAVECLIFPKIYTLYGEALHPLPGSTNATSADVCARKPPCRRRTPSDAPRGAAASCPALAACRVWPARTTRPMPPSWRPIPAALAAGRSERCHARSRKSVVAGIDIRECGHYGF